MRELSEGHAELNPLHITRRVGVACVGARFFGSSYTSGLILMGWIPVHETQCPLLPLVVCFEWLFFAFSMRSLSRIVSSLLLC